MVRCVRPTLTSHLVGYVQMIRGRRSAMKILPFALLAAALLINHPSLAQTESAPVRPAAPAASSPEPKAGPSGLKSGMGAMAVAPATPSTRQITVASLTEKEIKGQDGSDLGEINRMVESTADKKTYVVVLLRQKIASSGVTVRLPS